MMVQKQPSRGVLRKRCPENMQQMYRKTPMPKCDFNKVVLQQWLLLMVIQQNLIISYKNQLDINIIMKIIKKAWN